MKTRVINKTGIKAIKAWLWENHKYPDNAVYCLNAWVDDAQKSLDEGNSAPILEIPATHSVHGYTVSNSFNDDCFDTIELPDDAEPEEMDADSLSGFFGFAVEQSGDVTADMTDEDITALIETYAQVALDTDPPATFDHADMRAWIERQRDYLRDEAAE